MFSLVFPKVVNNVLIEIPTQNPKVFETYVTYVNVFAWKLNFKKMPLKKKINKIRARLHRSSF